MLLIGCPVDIDSVYLQDIGKDNENDTQNNNKMITRKIT